jgi:hypothetical protein
MRERTQIELSAADRAELKTIIANRNSPQKHVWRAKTELHALGVGALEICFNLVADHPPLTLVVVDGLLVQHAAGFKVLSQTAP